MTMKSVYMHGRSELSLDVFFSEMSSVTLFVGCHLDYYTVIDSRGVGYWKQIMCDIGLYRVSIHVIVNA